MSLSSKEIIQLINDLQKKFHSFENIQQNLVHYLNLLQSTHQQIKEDLFLIKNILNERQSSEEEHIRIESPLSFQSLSTNSQISSPIKSVTFSEHLITNLFQEHQQQLSIKPNLGYQLGNSLSPIRIHEIEQINGEYLRLLNISNTDDYDLTGYYIQQNISCIPSTRFTFPSNTFIRSGQTITIWCGSYRHIQSNPPHTFIWKEQIKWQTGPECVTILNKPTGQAIAWARSSNRIKSHQSSSDILFVRSPTNPMKSSQNLKQQMLIRPKSSPTIRQDVLLKKCFSNPNGSSPP